MNHWLDKIGAQLDEDKPRWVSEWCPDSYARDSFRAQTVPEAKRVANNAREHVQNNIIAAVIRAAIAAGVVKDLS